MLWLARLPLTVVRGMAELMPMLRAEETIRLAEAIAVGAGRLKSETARSITRRWEREASGGQQPPAIKATPADLQAMGIVVKRVKKRKQEPPHGER